MKAIDLPVGELELFDEWRTRFWTEQDDSFQLAEYLKQFPFKRQVLIEELLVLVRFFEKTPKLESGAVDWQAKNVELKDLNTELQEELEALKR